MFVTYMTSSKCLTPLPCYAVIIFIVLLIFMFVTYLTPLLAMQSSSSLFC